MLKSINGFSVIPNRAYTNGPLRDNSRAYMSQLQLERSEGIYDQKEIEINPGIGHSIVSEVSGNYSIKTPSGFSLSMAHENFKILLSDLTVEKGVIKEECGMVYTNDNLLLYPTSSDTYKAALKLENGVSLLRLRNNTIVSPGSVLMTDAGSMYIYLGRYRSINTTVLGGNRTANEELVLPMGSESEYALDKNGNIVNRSSLTDYGSLYLENYKYGTTDDCFKKVFYSPVYNNLTVVHDDAQMYIQPIVFNSKNPMHKVCINRFDLGVNRVAPLNSGFSGFRIKTSKTGVSRIKDGSSVNVLVLRSGGLKKII